MNTPPHNLADSTGARRPRVVVVEDHPMMRRAVMETLSRVMKLEVSGEAATEEEGAALVAEMQPDLALVDLTLKSGHGLRLVERAKLAAPHTRVLVYTMHDENLYAERAIRGGASGYVNKQSPTRVFRRAIETVLAGGIFVSDAIAERLRDVLGENHDNDASATASVDGDPRLNPAALETLTDRERHALQLIGMGKDAQQIAERLDLPVTDVDTVRARLREKLDVDNGGRLNRLAFRFVRQAS